jgi:alanyl-tRNA synthetase
MYDERYFNLATDKEIISKVLQEELNKFGVTLDKGLKEVEKIQEIDGKKAFDLYQTFGFPLMITEELFKQKGQQINHDEFENEFNKHRELSRTASAGMFKGGLADHSEETTRLHTAHHLMLAALQKLVDPSIRQRGSNITVERLRMDFNFARKLTPEEIQSVETLVNEKIKENMPVIRVELPKELAEQSGAQMEFGHKYPDRVSIYFVGLRDGVNPEQARFGDYYSAEFCGGPHVRFTGELGTFTIDREESAGAGISRIYAHLGHHEPAGSISTLISSEKRN